MQLVGANQEVDAAHRLHALASDDDGDLGPISLRRVQQHEPALGRFAHNHLVVGAVPLAQVALEVAEDIQFIVNREDDGQRH